MDEIEQLRHRTLVVRCQLGERPALEELYLRHHRALRYYLSQMLARDDVSDVQQEVWLTVIRQIGRLREPESFIVWLYRIARSKAANRLSHRGTIGVRDLEEVADDYRVDDEPTFTLDDAARIHRELGSLTPKHREVLLLRFMDDLSYEQIADVIGCTCGTVRSRLYYAKLQLRRQLEKGHERSNDA